MKSFDLLWAEVLEFVCPSCNERHESLLLD